MWKSHGFLKYFQCFAFVNLVPFSALPRKGKGKGILRFFPPPFLQWRFESKMRLVTGIFFLHMHYSKYIHTTTKEWYIFQFVGSNSVSHSVMSNSLRLYNYIAHQAPLSMEFSRQEYWSGLPFPSPWDLPNPGTEPSLLHYRKILHRLRHQDKYKNILTTIIFCALRSDRDSLSKGTF